MCDKSAFESIFLSTRLIESLYCLTCVRLPFNDCREMCLLRRDITLIDDMFDNVSCKKQISNISFRAVFIFSTMNRHAATL